MNNFDHKGGGRVWAGMRLNAPTRIGLGLLVVVLAPMVGREAIAPLIPALWSAPPLVLIMIFALMVTIGAVLIRKSQDRYGVLVIALAFLAAPVMADIASRW